VLENFAGFDHENIIVVNISRREQDITNEEASVAEITPHEPDYHI
jgi:hypothetical protein